MLNISLEIKMLCNVCLVLDNSFNSIVGLMSESCSLAYQIPSSFQEYDFDGVDAIITANKGVLK